MKMMWSRLRASGFPPLIGDNRVIKLEGKLILLERCNARLGNSIDLFSVRNLLCLRTLSNFITKGVENPVQSPGSYPDEDIFLELGPPVGQGLDPFPKSMTEGPQRFRRKTGSTRHTLSGSSTHAICSPSSINEGLELCSSSSDLNFGLENLEHSGSSDKDDGFLESGSSLPQGIGPLVKLMTEKPDPFVKTKSTRKVSAFSSPKSSTHLKDEALRLGNSSSAPLGKHKSLNSGPTSNIVNLMDAFMKTKSTRKVLAVSSPKSSTHLKDEALGLGNSPSATLGKLKNQNCGPRSNIGNKRASDIRSLYSVTVQKIPSTINLAQLKEAISIFGKISNATMRTVENGLNCCDVEFESVESSGKALSVGRIMVNSFDIRIVPLHAWEALTIRISNLNSRTDDSKIHSVCKSYGNLGALVRTKDDVVDALFITKDNYGLSALLKKLNNTIMDDCKWSANIQPPDSPSAVVANENVSQQRLGLQVHDHMLHLRGQLSAKMVYLEDLENLHCALMHLDSQPVHKETKAVNESQQKCQDDPHVGSM